MTDLMLESPELAAVDQSTTSLVSVPVRNGAAVDATRQALRLTPDPTRVVRIPLNYADNSLRERVWRVLALSGEQVDGLLEELDGHFGDRHRDLRGALEGRWVEIADRLGLDSAAISLTHQLACAAYLTMEYAIEAAALCNPSIVVAPDQNGVCAGSVRIVMSLRGIGEGHRSSIEFRSGTIDDRGVLHVDAAGRFAELGRVVDVIDDGYTIVFSAETPLSERVLFAAVGDESLGLEDARFVRVDRGGGKTTYVATYSAYDGFAVTLKIVSTDDFLTFVIRRMAGPGARDKGLAVFPRKIGGRWLAVSREDGSRLFLTASDDLVHWDAATPLAEPVYPWELLQMGNCGSPIETDEGWLVVTHGVGMLRRYVIGGLLLDRDDPSKVIGRTSRPLLEPAGDEREGYVPNVVYSCGGLIHNDLLVLPYAYSDRACSVATFDVADVVAAMR